MGLGGEIQSTEHNRKTNNLKLETLNLKLNYYATDNNTLLAT